MTTVARTDRVEVSPANQVSCAELDQVFGTKGSAAECRCQRYRLAHGESFGNTAVEVRIDRLHEQTACGDPASPQTTGLVAFVNGEPLGWCAVAPRNTYAGLVRNANQTAWRGRAEDRADPSVWAVTCVLVHREARGSGIARRLIAATVDFARGQGANRLEAYPITVPDATWGEEHPGPLSAYLDAGFAVIHEPSKRRAVVSIDL